MSDKILLQRFPARDWREATPVGNGRLGALVHGRASDERVALNHEALYNWAVRGELPDVSGLLPEVRRLLDEGRFAEAGRLYPERLKAGGLKSGAGKFFPAFDVRLRCSTAGAFRGYSRELDLSRGVCTVRWSDDGGAWERTVFAHCAAGAGGPVAIRVVRDGDPFDARVSLPRHDLADYPGYGDWDDFATRSFASDPCGERWGESAAEGRAGIFSTCRTPDGLDFCGMIRVMETDGEVFADDHGGIKITGAREIALLADVRDSPLSLEEFEASLAAFAGAPFGSLLSAHSSAFASRFDACRISLADPDAPQASNEQLLLDSYSDDVDVRLAEKMADFGRYLLISSSGFGCSRPANLQGVWNGDYSPAWGATYFLNENVEMMYWQALAGGLPETLLPLFDLCDRFKDDFRENARRLYGCRGLLLPVYMGDRGGLKGNALPHCVYWVGSSAWIAALYFGYWLYTRDPGFLRDRAWPFLRESALFYEDFLAEGADGRLHSYPAVSPENNALGSFDGAGNTAVSIDPTMDVALVRELLSNCLIAAEATAHDGPEPQRWRAMLARLPAYRANERGELREWLNDALLDNNRHRHLSHLYPLFPGHEISRHGAPELFAAARRAAEARIASGLADQTGWSLAHLACVWARLGEGDRALECLELLLRCCIGANLFTFHNDWRGMGVTLEMLHGASPPVQLDAAFGFAAAVQEMLLGADDSSLRILPALPAKWERGSVRGIRAPGGVSVDIEWRKNGTRAKISLDAAFGARKLEVHFPGNDAPCEIALAPGSSIELPQRGTCANPA